MRCDPHNRPRTTRNYNSLYRLTTGGARFVVACHVMSCHDYDRPTTRCFAFVTCHVCCARPVLQRNLPVLYIPPLSYRSFPLHIILPHHGMTMGLAASDVIRSTRGRPSILGLHVAIHAKPARSHPSIHPSLTMPPYIIGHPSL